MALISIFATAGIQYFESEIEALLIDDVFKHLCGQKLDDGKLKIICGIVDEHDLNSHAQAIRSLIISNDLSSEQKITLLKIKLDFIINGECLGKKRFLAMAILGLLLTFTFSGVGGLGLVLEALYRLFQEGKISKKVYKEAVETIGIKGRKWTIRKVLPIRLIPRVLLDDPLEHWLED
jgi:hypothetical protein